MSKRNDDILINNTNNYIILSAKSYSTGETIFFKKSIVDAYTKQKDLKEAEISRPFLINL